MTVTQGQLIRDIAAGGRAFEAVAPVTACPYARDESPLQARSWVRGWLLARDRAGHPSYAETALADGD